MTDNSYKLEDILDSHVLCLRILVMNFVEKIDLFTFLLYPLKPERVQKSIVK